MLQLCPKAYKEGGCNLQHLDARPYKEGGCNLQHTPPKTSRRAVNVSSTCLPQDIFRRCAAIFPSTCRPQKIIRRCAAIFIVLVYPHFFGAAWPISKKVATCNIWAPDPYKRGGCNLQHGISKNAIRRGVATYVATFLLDGFPKQPQILKNT